MIATTANSTQQGETSSLLRPQQIDATVTDLRWSSASGMEGTNSDETMSERRMLSVDSA